jgi:exodeoxyribonuclease VII large subunit
VQGEGAEESIVSALLALRGLTDVVIVCRGGGSAEDLWCFNSEAVARAIIGCDSPVISAVGHETDVTIADFAADMRAATPTAAAKMAVPDLEEVNEWLRQSEVRMMRALWTTLERKEERLEYLQHSISARRMYSLAADARQRLDYLGERLATALANEQSAKRVRLELAQGRLVAVGPRATLLRGYAVVRSNHGLILRAADARPGEMVELILGEGKLRCRVLEINDGSEVFIE